MQVSDIAIATHDEVWQLEDPDGFVALHRSRNQRAFGGVRIKRYDDTGEALRDVLRLSESMTRKCAINGIPGGGAKAVIVEQSIRDRKLALTALGQFVEHLRGRFETGPDLGLSADDLRILQENTTHVVREDLSPAAALGVIEAMRGAALAMFGSESLAGKSVLVQGLGAVGAKLAARVAEAGATLLVSDLDPGRVRAAERELGARAIEPDQVLRVECDVLAPSAVGQIVSDETVPLLACRLICGAANNVLESDDLADRLHERGITYVPDFLASSGAAVEGAWTAIKGPGDYRDRVLAIRERTRLIVTRAREAGTTPLAVALDLIREYL